MTLEQFWKILMKQWKYIVICFLFVGAGAFAGSKLMKPAYQSSALIQVVINSGTGASSYDNLLASEQLVQTEADLATSTPVLREVASHYPGLTETALAEEVSGAPEANTQLFAINVIDSDPTRAANLANDVATTLIKQQLQTMQQQNNQAQQEIQQNLDQTNQKIAQTNTAIQAAKGNAQQIALLQGQMTGLQQQYNQWQTALAQLELTQAQSGNTLQVVQPAQPVTHPVRPNIPLYTGGGLFAGLLLGILLALFFDRLDTRVRTPEELTQLLTWPALATIWYNRSTKAEDIIGPTGRNTNVEAYRILRTNIGFSGIDKPLRSLAVTSAVPGEGKSTIAANIAIFMARAGKSTLLIDADLRRPIQHTLFNLSPDKLGLSNAVLTMNTPKTQKSPFHNSQSRQLVDGVDPHTLLEPFVHAVGIPNLWVMPSGPLPPNPAEFLESQAMRRFLAVALDCGVEMLIVDTPPLIGLSDTTILASKFDGTLVVVDTMRATKDKLVRVKAVLLQAGVNVLGCVANKVQRKRNDTIEYYSYYYDQEQDGKEKPAKNSHIPSTPVTPAHLEVPVDQRSSAN